jgi:hypothetical protein
VINNSLEKDHWPEARAHTKWTTILNELSLFLPCDDTGVVGSMLCCQVYLN